MVIWSLKLVSIIPENPLAVSENKRLSVDSSDPKQSSTMNL